MPVIKDVDVYGEMRRQGMTPDEARVFTCIAYRESNFNLNAWNWNPLTKDDSYGLYQINYWGALSSRQQQISKKDAQQLAPSSAYAISLYRSRGNDWDDWYVSKNGTRYPAPNTLAYWGRSQQTQQTVEAAIKSGPSGGILTPGPQSTSPGSISLPGGGTVDLPVNPQNPLGLPDQQELASLVKDIVFVGLFYTIGITLILFGLWGVLNNSGAGSQIVSGTKTLGKKALRTFVPGAGAIV